MTFDDISEYFIEILDFGFESISEIGFNPINISLSSTNAITANIYNKYHDPKMIHELVIDDAVTSNNTNELPNTSYKVNSRLVTYQKTKNSFVIDSHKLTIYYPQMSDKLISKLLETSFVRLKREWILSPIKRGVFERFIGGDIRNMIQISVDIKNRQEIKAICEKVNFYKETHDIEYLKN